MIEIGFAREQQIGIAAGTGAATTTGGSIGGVGTGTGVDADIAPQTTDPISSVAADVTTPESHQQYQNRDLAGKLPCKGIYAQPCVWSDVLYWMDS